MENQCGETATFLLSEEIGRLCVVQEVIFGDLSVLVGKLGDFPHFVLRHCYPVLAEYLDVFPHRYASVAIFVWDGFLDSELSSCKVVSYIMAGNPVSIKEHGLRLSVSIPFILTPQGHDCN